MPTLVIHGEHTPLFFSRISEATGRCIPGSQILVIPNASHTMSSQNAASSNRGVLAFVDKHP